MRESRLQQGHASAGVGLGILGGVRECFFRLQRFFCMFLQLLALVGGKGGGVTSARRPGPGRR